MTSRAHNQTPTLFCYVMFFSILADQDPLAQYDLLMEIKESNFNAQQV